MFRITTMKLRHDVKCDSLQEPKAGEWGIRCPKCNRLLGVLDDLHGIVKLRFRCPRCGTYVIADLERSGVC